MATMKSRCRKCKGKQPKRPNEAFQEKACFQQDHHLERNNSRSSFIKTNQPKKRKGYTLKELGFLPPPFFCWVVRGALFGKVGEGTLGAHQVFFLSFKNETTFPDNLPGVKKVMSKSGSYTWRTTIRCNSRNFEATHLLMDE